MRSISTRHLLAALVAALVLALGTGTAAASRGFQATSAELENITKTGMLAFTDGIERITCEVTFHMRQNREIAKMRGAQIGVIEEARVGTCMGVARVTVPGQGRPNNVNWPKTYESFTGTLPSITSIISKVTGITFLVQGVFQGCQFRGDLRFTHGASMRSLMFEAGNPALALERTLFGECRGETLRVAGTLNAFTTVTYRLV